MKALMISAFRSGRPVRHATTMLRSHTPAAGRAIGSRTRCCLRELHAAPNVTASDREFEDQSLVYSRTKQ